MDYSLFEKILIKRICCFSIICSIALIVCSFGIIYIFRKMRDDKPMFFMLLALCVFGIAGSIIFGSNVVHSSLYDIKNQAYIVYEGTFSVESVQRSGRCFLTINDADKSNLDVDAYLLDGGEYSGKVIYGEKTKIVFDVQLDQD